MMKEKYDMVFKNILIPTDFSRNSSEAYEFALNFAEKNSSRLHVIHVLETALDNIDNTDDYKKERFEREHIFNAEEEIERFINKYSNAGVDICRTVIPGKAYKEIIKYAKDQNADLIIMATHGKTNLYHLVAGNVTKKVLRFSEIPVVCIKTNSSAVTSETFVHENLAENWVG